jgi:hypothetical protein
VVFLAWNLLLIINTPPMQDFKNLETTALVDLLARYTEQYTNKIIERNSIIELGQYEYEIALIQSELNSRQVTAANIPGNGPGY